MNKEDTHRSSNSFVSFLEENVLSFHNDIIAKCEVALVIHNMTHLVEVHMMRNECLLLKENYSIADEVVQLLAKRLNTLESNILVQQERALHNKIRARVLHEKLASNAVDFLQEGKTNRKLKARLEITEYMNSRLSLELDELKQLQISDHGKKIPENLGPPNQVGDINKRKQNFIENTPERILRADDPRCSKIALDLDDEILLVIFSFLHTFEVLQFAQICRFVYCRIDKIFGINSHIIKPEWSVKENSRFLNEKYSAELFRLNSFQNYPNFIEFRLSKEMVDSLTKRLSGKELKVILGLADMVTKYKTVIDNYDQEKEELSFKMKSSESVRDLLVDKLKSAEETIKSLIEEKETLIKKTTSDSEIITYLDLHAQELESQNSSLVSQNKQLRASLTLEVSARSLNENQRNSELTDLKAKFDYLEQSSKSQKKILVKEIKSLRAHIELLKCDLNTSNKTLQRLRDALDFVSK